MKRQGLCLLKNHANDISESPQFPPLHRIGKKMHKPKKSTNRKRYKYANLFKKGRITPPLSSVAPQTSGKGPLKVMNMTFKKPPSLFVDNSNGIAFQNSHQIFFVRFGIEMISNFVFEMFLDGSAQWTCSECRSVAELGKFAFCIL